jgi:hypothetical protein
MLIHSCSLNKWTAEIALEFVLRKVLWSLNSSGDYCHVYHHGGSVSIPAQVKWIMRNCGRFSPNIWGSRDNSRFINAPCLPTIGGWYDRHSSDRHNNWNNLQSYPHNTPWRPIGLRDVKDPTMSR